MNILLVLPPEDQSPTPGAAFVFEPLALEYLSSSLLAAGHATRIIDMAVDAADERAVVAETAAGRWDVVGIAINYMNRRAAVRLARGVKTAGGRHVVVGGHYVSLNPEAAADPAIDFIVIGEGERTLVELVTHLARSGADPESVAGVAWWRNGVFHKTAPRARISDLDALPHPDRRFYREGKYISLPGMPVRRRDFRLMSVLTSRGCAYDCGFCTNPAFWGRRWVGRSPDSVVAEIRDAVRGHGIRHVAFLDEDINTDRKRAVDLYAALKKTTPGLRWGCESALAHLDEDLIDSMAGAGCCSLTIGFESGSPEILAHFRKKYDLLHAIRVTHRARERGIFVAASFIIGFPWDSRRTIRETASFASALNANMYWGHLLRPRKGSAFHDAYVAREGGATAPCGDGGTADFFEAVLPTEHLSRSQVRRELAWFMARTLLRPAYFGSTARYLVSNPEAIDAYLEVARLTTLHAAATVRSAASTLLARLIRCSEGRPAARD